MTSLDRQWRDHVNDGAVVRWLRARLRRWAWLPQPTFLVTLVVRPHDVRAGAGGQIIAQIKVRADEQRAAALPLPIPVLPDERVVVAIEQIVITGALPGVAVSWNET